MDRRLSPTRRALRRSRTMADAARFAWWRRRIALRLGRNGSRLHVAGAVRFDTPPIFELPLEGEGPGSLTLRLGPGASLGRELILEVWAGGHSVLELGEDAHVGARCRLQLHSGELRIGPRAQIRDAVQIKSRGVVEIGERTIVSTGVIISADERVIIGEHTGVGERTSIIDTDHELDGGGGSVWEAPLRREPIEIGPGVLVGAGSVILRGSTIGAGAVIGAGSVVRGRQPAGWLVAGVPAQPVRALPGAPR